MVCIECSLCFDVFPVFKLFDSEDAGRIDGRHLDKASELLGVIHTKASGNEGASPNLRKTSH